MNNHTPGPWTAQVWQQPQWIVAHPSGYICVTSQGNDEANAHLIAGAPAMLAICESLATEPAKVQEIMRREGFIIDDLNDRWQKFAFTLYNIIVSNAASAEAAIAKAGGNNGRD